MNQVGALTAPTNAVTRARVRNVSLRHAILVTGAAIICAGVAVTPCHGAVALNALGQFLTTRGYGGAQLVRIENFYRLPINSNGKAGDLLVDTGAGISTIYRASLDKLGLSAIATDHVVHGAFGEGREVAGRTTIHSLIMGNCTLLNFPVGVISDTEGRGIFRRYGASDGILGCREMYKFAAVVDLGNRLLFVRPNGPNKEIGIAVRSLLTAQGYTAVAMALEESHLTVAAAVNGWACRLIVDTGAFLTLIDREAASKAKIGGTRTFAVAQGLGKSGGEISVAQFPRLRIGDYEIKSASAGVIRLDNEVLKRGTPNERAGLLGAEYLGKNSAVFDFNSGILYLKSKPTR
jgi:predicted aspartyl protease